MPLDIPLISVVSKQFYRNIYIFMKSKSENSLFIIHPHAVPVVYDFLYSDEHKLNFSRIIHLSESI